MSQPEDWGVQEAGPATPQAFAGRINESLDALLSLHKGEERPEYAVAGTMWIDDTATPWVLNQYDGDTDIKIAEIDQSTHKVKLFAEEAAFVGDVTVGGNNLRRSRGEPYPGSPTDFNDMTTPGFYNTSGSGWSNGPLGSSTHTGSLEVLGRSGGSGLVQIWRSHNNGLHYVRAFDPPTWTSWARLLSTSTVVQGPELLIGKDTNSDSIAGVHIASSGRSFFTRDGSSPVGINRLSSDGDLLIWYQDTTQEGAVSVSGTTVSYGSFCAFHWSQLADHSTPDILRGSIMECIDMMCLWKRDEWDEIVETDDGPKLVRKHRIYAGPLEDGDTYTDDDGIVHTIIEEDNEQLARVKVSDTVGSKRVYGVFMCWSPNDDGSNPTGDMAVASSGAFLVRIKAGEEPEIGDLIESAGDGTGRVQADDCIRSSTVAKITATTPVEIYDDGSFLLPCTLHCG